MEAPCYSGLIGVRKSAIYESGENIPFKDITISKSGEKI